MRKILKTKRVTSPQPIYYNWSLKKGEGCAGDISTASRMRSRLSRLKTIYQKNRG